MITCVTPPCVFFYPGSEELRKEARQLKKELQAIKHRKEDGSKAAVGTEQEGNRKQLVLILWRHLTASVVPSLR